MRNGHTYLYYQKSDGQTIFLGKVGEITKYPNRVMEPLDIYLEKISNNLESENKLISIMPYSKRQSYVSKLLKKLTEETNYLSSLSPSASKKYKSKGQETAEQKGTKRRLPTKEVMKARTEELKLGSDMTESEKDAVIERVSKLGKKREQTKKIG